MVWVWVVSVCHHRSPSEQTPLASQRMVSVCACVRVCVCVCVFVVCVCVLSLCTAGAASAASVPLPGLVHTHTQHAPDDSGAGAGDTPPSNAGLRKVLRRAPDPPPGAAPKPRGSMPQPRRKKTMEEGVASSHTGADDDKGEEDHPTHVDEEEGEREREREREEDEEDEVRVHTPTILHEATEMTQEEDSITSPGECTHSHKLPRPY